MFESMDKNVKDILRFCNEEETWCNALCAHSQLLCRLSMDQKMMESFVFVVHIFDHPISLITDLVDMKGWLEVVVQSSFEIL